MPAEAPLRALLRAIGAAYGEAGGGPAAMAARRLARAAGEPLRLGDGTRMPVCRCLAEAVRLAGTGPLAELAAAFAAAEPRLDWLQNPNYVACPPETGFLDRYGYVELVGPGRAVASADLLVGLLLLAPGTHYPDHRHPAEEDYRVVAGRAAWWREGEGWRVVPPGGMIHHASGVRHAMRTYGEPLLALYAWTGEIAVAARLAAEPTAGERDAT